MSQKPRKHMTTINLWGLKIQKLSRVLKLPRNDKTLAFFFPIWQVSKAGMLNQGSLHPLNTTVTLFMYAHLPGVKIVIFFFSPLLSFVILLGWWPKNKKILCSKKWLDSSDFKGLILRFSEIGHVVIKDIFLADLLPLTSKRLARWETGSCGSLPKVLPTTYSHVFSPLLLSATSMQLGYSKTSLQLPLI